MIPEILYEDNHLIIVNKPNGLLTHGDLTGDESLESILKNFVRLKYNRPGNVFVKPVHRLDRPVSGAIILARTSKGHERMTELFRKREVYKTYWALTVRKPHPEAGIVEQYLFKNRERNIVEWSDTPREGYRHAITEYRLIAEAEPYFWVELHPITGRSHQLRVMLRSKRCPIVGDVKYHGRKIDNPRALMLHSRSLEFIHPVKNEKVQVVAEPPGLPEWEYVRSFKM